MKDLNKSKSFFNKTVKLCALKAGIIVFFVGCRDQKERGGPTGDLFKVTEEESGENCLLGGFRLDSGIDSNGNGILDSIEIETTSFICNEVDELVHVIEEPIGVNCSAGGFKIETGHDTNGNGQLDGTEIESTKYLCNGKTDEQLRFKLEIAETRSKTGLIAGDLIKFNKNYFEGVDSIIFVANPYSASSSNRVLLELYNITDDVVIETSILSTNDDLDHRTYMESKNLFKFLPDKEITLGIKLRTENEGQFVSSGSTFLFLYREK